MIFIDTSVLVAIVAAEEDAQHFGAIIDADGNPLTSPVVLLEASMRLSTLLGVEPAAALARLESLMAQNGTKVVTIDKPTTTIAVDAFARYGKGRHPARLNFADCLSYACAKAAGATLLYKGNDFARTDMG